MSEKNSTSIDDTYTAWQKGSRERGPTTAVNELDYEFQALAVTSNPRIWDSQTSNAGGIKPQHRLMSLPVHAGTVSRSCLHKCLHKISASH